MAAQQQNLAVTLCLFDGFNLLLPSAVIAEIMSGVAARAGTGEGDYPWLVDHMSWREMELPVISFEQLFLQRNSRLRGSHLAVLRGFGKNGKLPFYAVPMQAAPQPFTLNGPGELEELEDAGRLGFVERAVKVRGVDAVIPRLADLEAQLASSF